MRPRGDIGSTAAAYAEGFLGQRSPWGADALTVSPYLGDDSLRPFIEVAQKRSAGVFVLVKTSNPSSGELQDVEASGKTIYERVAGWLGYDYSRKLELDEQGTLYYGMVDGNTTLRQIVSRMAAQTVQGQGFPADLVGDLAGLLCGRGVGDRPLARGEDLERAERDVRRPGQAEPGGQERVASEQCQEPGSAGGIAQSQRQRRFIRVLVVF